MPLCPDCPPPTGPCAVCPVNRVRPRLLPVLAHDHDWVDTTVLEDQLRVEICAAAGCTATRQVPR